MEKQIIHQKMAFHQPPYLPPNFKKVILGQTRRQAAHLNRLFWSNFEELKDQPISLQLKNLRTPTYIIWGKHDQLVDVTAVDALSALIPSCKTRELENVGHMPHLEAPKLTASLHREFLASSQELLK